MKSDDAQLAEGSCRSSFIAKFPGDISRFFVYLPCGEDIDLKVERALRIENPESKLRVVLRQRRFEFRRHVLGNLAKGHCLPL